MQQPEVSPNPENKVQVWQIVGVILMLLVALGLFYAGYEYINFKMAEFQDATETSTAAALMEIQEANSLNIEILQETLNAILAEMAEIRYSLSEAGQTLDSSTVVQQNLTLHLSELEEQLKELQQAIDLLKD